MLRNFLLLLLVLIMLLPAITYAGRGVSDSPHNLSASGTKTSFIFSDETRVCVFCHTPHNAQPALWQAPLWNRELVTQNYTMYDSTYFEANVKPVAGWQPTGASRICLSCHDGTIALNAYGGRVGTTPMSGVAKLGTDLSNDHPISFPYTTELFTNTPLTNPSSLTGLVKLDNNSYVQCTSCHDPHDNENGKFLVMNCGDPANPAPTPLCVTCHTPPGWADSPHNIEDGCMNCHSTHNAQVSQYLLKAPADGLCFNNSNVSCHASNLGSPPTPHAAIDPALFAAGPGRFLWNFIKTSVFLASESLRGTKRGADLKTVFDSKIYRHPIGQHQGVHTKNEKLPIKQVHVECVDCHGAHLAGGPDVSSGLKRSLRGVKGVSAETMVGATATREFEICFKCHAGVSAASFVSFRKPNRMIQEADQMKRFRAFNPSSHPLTVDRRGNGESLLDEFRNNMIRIDCTDCHNSDDSKKAGGSGPNGPHASRYEHILMARYEMPPSGGRQQTGCNSYRSDYDLCFRCHSENYVMAFGTSFANGIVNEHVRHVVDRCLPCAACHDPHGVPAQNGATAATNAHLINFDRGYAAGRLTPLPKYQSTGTGGGNCTVNCHTLGNHSYVR